MDNLFNQLFIQQINSQISVWAFVIVFIAGIISSLSPCTLGILPIIIGYVSGNTDNKSKNITVQLLFFILGLSGVLTVLGVAAALAGKALGGFSSPHWALLLASFILVMGLNLLEILEVPIPAIIKQMPKKKGNNLFLYPIVLGGAFAFASTPCSTPILAGIMAYASLKANLLFGGLMLFVYALGQGVILIFAGVFTSLFRKFPLFRKLSGFSSKFSGVILILAAFYIYLKIFGIA